MYLPKPVGATGPTPPPPRRFAFESCQNIAKNMAWEGTLGQVFEELGENVGKKPLGEWFWQPSRVLRAVIDSGLSGADRVMTVTAASRFATKAYARGLTGRDVRRMKEMAESMDLQDAAVRQEQDDCTAQATVPELSGSTAEQVLKKVAGPVFFTVLCHGGFVAGVETFLYFRRQRQDALLYPLRLSMYKHRDKRLLVQPAELAFMREQARGSAVVVCDEDSSTGETMAAAVDCLQKEGIGKMVIGIVNRDERPGTYREQQGEWWENLRPEPRAKQTGFVALKNLIWK